MGEQQGEGPSDCSDAGLGGAGFLLAGLASPAVSGSSWRHGYWPMWILGGRVNLRLPVSFGPFPEFFHLVPYLTRTSCCKITCMVTEVPGQGGRYGPDRHHLRTPWGKY